MQARVAMTRHACNQVGTHMSSKIYCGGDGGGGDGGGSNES